jgi:hypothetical protein
MKRRIITVKNVTLQFDVLGRVPVGLGKVPVIVSAEVAIINGALMPMPSQPHLFLHKRLKATLRTVDE